MNFERYASAASSASGFRPKRSWWAWAVSFVFMIFVIVGYRAVFAPPPDFPKGSLVNIASGASAQEVAAQLADARIIAHPGLLRTILRISGGSIHIQSGPYLFNTPEDLFSVAYRLVTGAFGVPPVRITFPEGETVRNIATRVNNVFLNISVSDFISKAQPYEGYLFPDTYLFLPSADADTIIKAMRANFDEKMAPLLGEVDASGHSLSDIVIMASLIEKEARTSSVRHMVAGILYNRLALGMPLQVDAVFGYIFNRGTYSPSFEDLKVDSPYNTYTHKGLPPGAINNPSLDSIDAALHPTKTGYFYYLTDAEGVMHYATIYAGHQANQARYLH